VIEINLIPQKVKKQKKMQMVIMAAGAGGALVVAGMLAYVFFWQSKTGAIMSEIRKIDAESASLQDKIEEVKRFNAMEEAYKKKKAVIDSLMLEQSVWAEILDRTGEMVLPDMWLTNLAQEKIKDEGIGIRVAGNAMSKVVVAEFLKRLETSPKIMDLTAEQIGTSDAQGISLVTFTISFLYKTN